MSTAAARLDIPRFRELVASRLGLQFDEARQGLLADVLQHRLARLDLSCEVYLRALAAGTQPGEAAALASELTVGETYFFRNGEQFRAFRDLVLPQRAAAEHGGGPLRILSAGCSSGEEPYSLAILLREAGLDPALAVEISAVDLNPTALEGAARARYSPWSLRETPAETRRKWFRANGRALVLDDTIRAAVRFAASNLAADDPALWRTRWFDTIFCRNVVMYFAPEAARALLARIADALKPGGYLFLGHAETLRGLSEAFHLRHTHGTFYYQRKDDDGDDRAPPPQAIWADRASWNGGAPGLGDSWVDVIRGASERVATLAAATRSAPSRPPRWPPHSICCERSASATRSA